MSEYELSPHRYKELKHFCLQYREIKDKLLSLDLINYICNDPTARTAILKTEYMQALKLIETTAYDTDFTLFNYILKGVSEDISYSELKIPCSKYMYDYLRQKFFWLLSNRKGYS